jgi:hypothetical protein
VVVSTLGDGVLIEVGLHTSFELSTKATDAIVWDKVAEM